MSSDNPKTGLQLRSLIKSSGELEVSLAACRRPNRRRTKSWFGSRRSPINPSDLGLLFGAADMSTAKVSGTQGSAGGDGQSAGSGDEGDGGAAR